MKTLQRQAKRFKASPSVDLHQSFIKSWFRQKETKRALRIEANIRNGSGSAAAGVAQARRGAVA